MRRGRLIRAAGLAVALAVTGAACGDDDVDTGATPGRLRLVYEAPADGQVPAGLNQAVVERLLSIGIVVEGVDTGTPGEVTVDLEDDRTLTLASELLRQQGVLRIRPVLGVVPGAPPGLPITPVVDDAADQPVVLSHRDREAAIDQTYQLGPAVIDDAALATATAEEDAGGILGIRLVLDPAAVPGFEDAAALCFAKAVTCPLGQLAVTVDGAVLAAPEVAQPSFEGGELVVTPQLDDAGIRRLATVLAEGPLPVALVPAVRVDDEG